MRDATTVTRRGFLELCGILGLTAAVPGLAAACTGNGDPATDETVLIVGAGPAGLTAGYLLQQQGVEFEVLEALPTHGGRIKRTNEFVDFPIPLGAEWIHVQPDILSEIVNDPTVDVGIDTTMYDNDSDFALYEGVRATPRDVFGIDSKFVGSSWLDFFDQYIVPSVAPRITYDTVVESIDYRGDQIAVSTQNGDRQVDRVIVTAPVKMLQLGAITFVPPLPQAKQDAIDQVNVWDGCKAFIEFAEKFYPTAVGFEITPESAGQKLYYDASYGQDSTRNVLGLFAVGTGTKPYVDLTDEERITFMLAELDEIFAGQATPNYQQDVFQNWNVEPFARGAYLTDNEDWRLVRELGKNVDGRLFFAGDGYTTGDDWSSVHTAARSARRAVQEILGID